ncbi:MAG: glycosyltransferase family 39 protein [Bryobacteraceae bacterium]
MSTPAARFHKPLFWGACSLLLLLARLCHLHVLWVDEAYGIAAARRILEGAALYRDVWFDKPPLYAWIYLLWGAQTGWPLRLGGALFALLSCWLAFRAAAALFTPREGYAAAAALAFFLSFDHPFALIPLAPDLLLVPFAFATVWALAAGRATAAGLCAAAGLLANTKALFLLPLALVWHPRQWWRLFAAWAAGAAAAWLLAWGWEEPVWIWGAAYSREALFPDPFRQAVLRTLNWSGFHFALIAAAALYFAHREPYRLRLAAWIALGLAAVAAGARFFPRYYFALLAPLAITAGRGFQRIRTCWLTTVLLLSLGVPAARFGSRHLGVLFETPAAMRDLAMWTECWEAAAAIRARAAPGDTLLVWGYRPELNVLAGLPGATRFLDSQPLTGVLADRHLSDAHATFPELARRHRQELVRSSPVFVADGLGPYNPQLAISRFDDLRPWLARYELVAETPGFRIYRRR